MTDSKTIGKLVSVGATMGRLEGAPGSLGAHQRRVEKPIGSAPGTVCVYLVVCTNIRADKGEDEEMFDDFDMG